MALLTTEMNMIVAVMYFLIVSLGLYYSNATDITNYYYNDKPFSRVFGISLKYHFGGELVKSNSKKTEEQERL